MENENEISEVQEQKKLTYEELQAELKNVRNEAASRRIEIRDLKAKADEWDKYQESQKTELEKLQDALKERDNRLSKYEVQDLRNRIAEEFEFDKELADALVGSDEASLRSHAEKLKALKPKAVQENPRPVDLLAGNRGTPIGSPESSYNFDDIIRRLAK